MEDEFVIDPGNECARKSNCYFFTMTGSCTPEAEAKYFACLAEKDAVIKSLIDGKKENYWKANWHKYAIGAIAILIALYLTNKLIKNYV